MAETTCAHGRVLRCRWCERNECGWNDDRPCVCTDRDALIAEGLLTPEPSRG